MPDWYASSAAYAAIAAFVPSAVYSVGNIVKPTAPAALSRYVFRCSIAGTASTEPAWPATNNATITTGGATFTNVTGQSAYGWSAAAGDIPTLTATGTVRFQAGDRLFVSSDHAETQAAAVDYGTSTAASYILGQMLSVNRAGSVPPVAADLLAGASVTVSGFNPMNFGQSFPIYYYGISFIYTGSFPAAYQFGNAGGKTAYFDACLFYLNTASGCRIQSAGTASIVLNNTPIRFGNNGCYFQSANVLEIVWQNTPTAIQGTAPTTLFNPSSGQQVSLIARGVDFSAVTGAFMANTVTGSGKLLLDSCRIASGVARYPNSGSLASRDMLELVNCYDGTSFISESWQSAGAVTTEFTITLSGGAQDNVGTYSHKMVSTGQLDKYAAPLAGFWLDANYATTGSAKTATVEIISSASLNNDEISLLLEYEGTASSSLASFITSLPATVLTTPAAVTTSPATWNSSPATPVKQRLQATFTPRTAGRVRAQVRLGKPSATVYYNPQVTIS